MTLEADQVDDAVLGFAEMMTIKLGEMMDQPRHVRIAAIANEKKRREEQEQARLEKLERDKANFEKLQKLKGEIAAMYDAAMPTIQALADGSGEISEQRRVQRKGE